MTTAQATVPCYRSVAILVSVWQHWHLLKHAAETLAVAGDLCTEVLRDQMHSSLSSADGDVRGSALHLSCVPATGVTSFADADAA
eukprot:3423-Heterococcus_DN1.PRE.2